MKSKNTSRQIPIPEDLINILCSNHKTLSAYKNTIEDMTQSSINKTVAKSCRFRKIEMKLIKGFLKKNDMSFGLLVKALFYHNGDAFNDVSIAVMQNEGMNIKFAETDPTKWNTRDYLPNTKVDYEKEYKDDSTGENPSINFHRFQADLIDQYLKKSDSHFNKFVKESLLMFKIFPKGMEGVVKLQERAVSSTRALGNSSKAKTMTLTTHPFERFFITNFVMYAQTINKDLTLSKLIKYRLHELNYIPDLKGKKSFSDLKIDIEKIKKGFVKTKEYIGDTVFHEKTLEQYEDIYNQDKAGTANISLSFSKDDAEALESAYKSEGFTSITLFTRDKVWKDYGIYPYAAILEVIEEEKKRGRKN